LNYKRVMENILNYLTNPEKFKNLNKLWVAIVEQNDISDLIDLCSEIDTCKDEEWKSRLYQILQNALFHNDIVADISLFIESEQTIEQIMTMVTSIMFIGNKIVYLFRLITAYFLKFMNKTDSVVKYSDDKNKAIRTLSLCFIRLILHDMDKWVSNSPIPVVLNSKIISVNEENSDSIDFELVKGLFSYLKEHGLIYYTEDLY